MGLHGSTCYRVRACGQAVSPALGSPLFRFPHGTMCILPWLQPELLTAHHPGVGSGCKAGWGEGLTPSPPSVDPLPTWPALSWPLWLVVSPCRLDPKAEVIPQASPQDPPRNVPPQHLLPSFPVLAHGGHVGSGGETQSRGYITGQMCRSRPLPPALTALACPTLLSPGWRGAAGQG